MDRDHAATYRWGGAFLGVGFVLVILAILAYILIYGQPEASNPENGITLADRVSHLQANWNVAQTMWRIEIVGVALLIVAGFILQHQRQDQDHRFSPRLAWSLFSAGAVILFLSYPLMLSGYPEAVNLFETEPGLMAVLNSVAWFTFIFWQRFALSRACHVIYAWTRIKRRNALVARKNRSHLESGVVSGNGGCSRWILHNVNCGTIRASGELTWRLPRVFDLAGRSSGEFLIGLTGCSWPRPLASGREEG